MRKIVKGIVGVVSIWVALTIWVVHKQHERVACLYSVPAKAMEDCGMPSSNLERFVHQAYAPFIDIYDL